MAEVFLTKEGKAEKEKYLNYLKTEMRAKVIQDLKTAREFGDLSENCEYDAARDAQANLEEEIALIEETLRVAKIVDTNRKKQNNIVGIGSKVKMLDEDEDEEIEYTIVGALESNPDQGLISNESPIGLSVMNKKVGDEISVTTPGGVTKMKILAIN